MPDTSPNVPVPGAPTSREASAQAAAADGDFVPTSGRRVGDTPAAVRTTSPPPVTNFDQTPVVTQEAYAYDRMEPQGA